MSDSRHPPLSSLFPFSLKDLKTTLFILAIAVGVCILLQRLDPAPALPCRFSYWRCC